MLDAAFPVQNVVGEPGKGFIYAMNAFDKTRPAVSGLLLQYCGYKYGRVYSAKWFLVLCTYFTPDVISALETLCLLCVFSVRYSFAWLCTSHFTGWKGSLAGKGH